MKNHKHEKPKTSLKVSNTNVSLQIYLTFGNIMLKCIC